jgi:RHS repeat-associated protein
LQYTADLYYAYLQRGPDDGGLGFWAGQAAGGVTNRTNVCNAFEGSGEFQTLVANLYGTAASDNERTEHFVNNFYRGAYGRDATSTEIQQQRDALNAAAAQSQAAVQTQAETFGRSLFAGQVNDGSISDTQFVTNLYEAFLQRGPDAGGLGWWSGQATVGTGRQNVLGAFAGCPAFRDLSGTLYREANWLVSDHLGTPRMIANKSGSLASTKRHDYLPFGEELLAYTGGRTTTQGYNADSVRQKFTSKERDNETGLDYFGARYYGSAQGRFTSVDPALTSADVVTPQSWNRYASSFNNPVRYIDPTGAWNWSATMGSNSTDEQLRKNAGKDKNALKAANKIIDQRNLFRNGLNAARESGTSSDEPDSVARAVNAYGSEGDSNGVSVTFGTVADGTAAQAGPSANGSLAFDTNGVATAQVLVTISSSVTNSNDLAQAIGHEGWHTADRQSFAAYLTRQIQAAGGLANFIGTPLESQAFNSPYNRTVQTTELNAYIVSGLIAQGRDALSKNFPNSSFNGHEVWNNSWSRAERPGLRAVGAFEHVTTSPTYSSKLNDRQFQP